MRTIKSIGFLNLWAFCMYCLNFFLLFMQFSQNQAKTKAPPNFPNWMPLYNGKDAGNNQQHIGKL